ncbi:MAG: glycosyltransferase family 2 protein [Bacteroidia bacterium]|nr:glycosyltransferase family 2 protein [Bacteroidia bacterium]
MMKELSVLIPVYNSASCIEQTISKTIEALKRLNISYELILIDDASEDNTWQIVKQLKQTNEHILGVKFSKNYGQHNALLCGLKIATGHFIVTMDDDLEQNPEDISLLYNTIKQNDYDLVYGSPINTKKGFIRRIATRIYKKLSQVENKRAGEGSPFRIISKSLKDNLLLHDSSLFFIDEIALWYTDKIEYEPVKFLPSAKRNSRYSFGSLFTLSLRVLSLSSTMPLRFVRVLGIYMSVTSIILALYFILRKLIFQVPSGFTAIIVAVLLSAGIITFSLGVIGEYLGNLISLSNKKPSYHIKEKI